MLILDRSGSVPSPGDAANDAGNDIQILESEQHSESLSLSRALFETAIWRDGWSIIVRNTFIELTVETFPGGCRRSASSPPKLQG